MLVLGTGLNPLGSAGTKHVVMFCVFCFEVLCESSDREPTVIGRIHVSHFRQYPQPWHYIGLYHPCQCLPNVFFVDKKQCGRDERKQKNEMCGKLNFLIFLSIRVQQYSTVLEL